MYKFIILSVTLGCSFVDGGVYSTCYPYETYCLFSFGPNVTVSNVRDAQKICEDAKHGSWLLEIVGYRTLKNVDEFISNNFYPEDTKLILNANKVNNKWRWINNKSDIKNDILKVIKENGDVTFYHQLVNAGQKLILNNHYAVLCMTGCYSKLEIYENQRISFGTHDRNATRDQCWEMCESISCEIWSWKTKTPNFGCWYLSPIGNGRISDNDTESVYKLDRSVKTTDKCIGNITELPNFPGSTANNFAEMKQLILVHVIPLSILLAINITAAVIFWRILKKKQQIIQELQGSSGQEYEEIDHKFEETTSKYINELFTQLSASR